jgi:hypothetical protein
LKNKPKPWTYKSWTPELSKLVDVYYQRVLRYGFSTDRDEVCYELGIAMLVVSHRLSRASLKNMMSITLEAELMSIPYERRKRALLEIYKIYNEAIIKIRASSNGLSLSARKTLPKP